MIINDDRQREEALFEEALLVAHDEQVELLPTGAPAIKATGLTIRFAGAIRPFGPWANAYPRCGRIPAPRG